MDGSGRDGQDAHVKPYNPGTDWTPDPKTMTYALHVGPVATVYEPDDRSEIAGFPRAYAIDTGTVEAPSRLVITAFSQNDDLSDAELVVSTGISQDGGETFPQIQLRTNSPTNLLRQPSGMLLDIGFRPISADGNKLLLDTATSDDNGQTWRARESTAVLLAPIKPLGRTHRGLTMLDDGTTLVPHYATLSDDTRSSVFALRTADEGQTFLEQGLVARATETLAFNETTIVRTTRGDLLAVFRTHEADSLSELRFSRSNDEGRTWTEAQALLVKFGSDTASPRLGVDPTLTLMPNGVLLLSAGRPDNWIACSWDGTGDTWEDATITYVNYPEGSVRHRGSSGYTGLAATESNRSILVGDNCAPSWGCPDTDSGHTVDNRYRVWRRMIDVLTPGVGKIDLAGKQRAGTVKVSGSLVFRSSTHPRIGLAAAFDGSTEPWSSALQHGEQAGDITIELDRVYQLHRVGLLLAWGHEASARVSVSLDGQSWSLPVLDTGPRYAHSLEYFDLERAVRARFVRVHVDSTDCPPGIEGSCAWLGELEIYGDVDSFENDAIGAIPRGYTGSNLASVVASQSDAHGRVLRIHDTSSEEHALLRSEGQPGTSFELSFAIAPQALPQAFLFDILGTTQEGDTVSSYHFGIFSDGSLRVWDEGIEQWTALSEPGQVLIGSWSEVSVTASLQEATIQVNGSEAWSTAPSATGATSLIGHAFGSAGTKPVGDDVLIDDVWFDVNGP